MPEKNDSESLLAFPVIQAASTRELDDESTAQTPASNAGEAAMSGEHRAPSSRANDAFGDRAKVGSVAAASSAQPALKELAAWQVALGCALIALLMYFSLRSFVATAAAAPTSESNGLRRIFARAPALVACSRRANRESKELQRAAARLVRSMSKRLRRAAHWAVVLLSIAATVVGTTPAMAGNYFWDADADATDNVLSGTGLGGTGTWDLNTANWWDGISSSNDILWPNSLNDTATFLGSGTVTLSADLLSGGLIFKSPTVTSGIVQNYLLTGSNLTLGTSGVFVDMGDSATIDSQLKGTSGLVKNGFGSLILTNSNNLYTGPTIINAGALVITNVGALGVDTSPVVVHGNQTRGGNNSSIIPAFSGGQLVIGGGITFGRTLSISGGGPTGDGAALVLVGSNTLTNVSSAISNAARIAGSPMSMTTITNLTIGTNVTTQLGGNGNYTIGSLATVGGNGSGLVGNGTTLLQKVGSGTAILSNTTNTNFAGQVDINAGFLRVSSAASLGTNVNGVRLSGGTLEIRADASTANFKTAANLGNLNSTGNTTIFVDRAIGGSYIGNVGAASITNPNSITLGQVFHNSNTTITVSGRNGIGLVMSTGTAASANFSANGPTAAYTMQGGNPVTLTNSSNGLVQIGTLAAPSNVVNTNDGTARTYTFNGNGDKLITGSLVYTGAAHVVTQAGTGMLTILGNASSYSGVTNTSAGTLSIAQFGAGSGSGSVGSGVVNIGNATTTTGLLNYLGLGGGAAYGGTGAGETRTTARVQISTTSATNGLFANQTGTGASALSLNSLANTTGTTGSIYFGGANTAANTISGAITGTGGFNVGKTGTGNWVLSGNNTYTGLTGIYGGTLTFASTAMTSLTGGLVFNSDVTNAAPSTTVATGGFTGAQTAGGTFQFNAGATNLTFTGALTGAAGAGNILQSGTGALTFGSLTAHASSVPGSTLNFTPGSGSIKFTAATGTAGTIIAGNVFVNGTDFAVGVAAGGTVAAPANYTAGNFLTVPGAGGGTSTINYLATTGADTTAGAFVANSLKINQGTTLTLGGTLTMTTSATAPGGILFDNSVGTGGITGGTIAASTAATELIFYTGGSTPGNAFTVASNIASASAIQFTKSGTGTLILSGTTNTFTGNVNLLEGTTILSGTAASQLGAPAAGTTLTIRQGATLDINGSGPTATLYGTTTMPLLTVGALIGGGSTSRVTSAQTTTTGAVTNSTTFTVASAAGITLGQTVIGLTAVNGAPNSATAIVTGINGTTITVSNPITLTAGNNLNFISTVTTGATITNNGAAGSAISIGASTANVSGTFTGLIRDGSQATTVVRNGASGTVLLTGMNTYTGATVLSGSAVLAVSNLSSIGMPSGIGKGDPTSTATNAASLVFNGGSLQYIGTLGTTSAVQYVSTPSVSIDRLFTMAGNGTILSDGTFGNNVVAAGAANNAALVFSNAGSIAFAGTTGARLLTLSGGSTGDNEFHPIIGDMGTGTNITSVTKAGSGLWQLTGQNTYTGTTTVSAGALYAIDGTGLPTSSLLTLSGGVLQSSGNFTRTLGTTPGSVQLTAATTGFSAYNGKLVVAFGGTSSPTALTWGTGSFAPSTLQFGYSAATDEVELKNAINLNGAVRNVSTIGSSFTSTAFATLSGVLSGTGTSGLNISGGGTLRLTAANTYSGQTIIGTSNNTTLIVSSLGNSVTNGTAATSVGLTSNATTAAVVLGSTTVTGLTLVYVGPGETTDRNIQIAGTTAGPTIDASGTGALALTNVTVTGSGAKTLTLTGNNADMNTITSNLADVGGALGITKTTAGNGGGTWALTGNNTFSGTFSLSAGALGVGSNTALGVGTNTFTFSNGNIFFFNGATQLANPMTLSNGTQAFTGQNSMIFSGNVSNTGGNSTIINALPSGATLTFSGQTMNLQETTNARTVNIIGNGTTIISATVQNGGSAAGGLSINVPGGTVQLNGSSPNTYTGGTTLSNGTLILGKVGALGAVTGTFALNGSALTATTDLSGANAIGNPTTIGITQGFGATIYGSNSISFSSTFGTVAGTQTVTNNLTGPAALNLTGTLNLNNLTDTTARRFVIYGSGTTNVTGTIQPLRSVSNDLYYEGTGVLNLATTGVNGQQGSLVINGGTVSFAGSSANTPLGFVNITANTGGTLLFDNTTNNNVNYRAMGINTGAAIGNPQVFGAATTIQLAGGTLNFTANAAGTSESETLLTLGNGASTILFKNTAGNASVLSFAGLTQNAGSTVNIVTNGGVLGSTDKIMFLPTTYTSTIALMGNAGILPRFLVGNDFATYDHASGITAFTGYDNSNNLDNISPLATANITATPVFTGATNGTIRATSGATAYGIGKTINALALNGNSLTVGGGAQQMVITSGGVLVNGTGATLAAKVLNQGSVETIFHVTSGNDLTISSAILGTGGLTVADGGSVTLNGQLLYSGATTVNGGMLKLGTGVSMPIGPTITSPTLSALNINYGTFDLNGNNAFVAALTTNGAANGISALPSSTTILDNSAAGTTSTLVVQGGNNTFAGSIRSTGAGSSINFYKTGNTTLTLANANTFAGSVTVQAGTLQLLHSGTLAAGTITVNNATLTLDNTGQSNNNNRISDTAAISLNNGTLTLQGQPFTGTTETLGTIAAATGGNNVNATAGTQGMVDLTIGNITRAANSATTFNFTPSGSGAPGLGGGRIVLNAINGVATTDGQTLPVWVIVNSSDYGFYRSNGAITEANGILPLGVQGSGNYQTQTVNFASQPVSASVMSPGNYTNFQSSITSTLLMNPGINATGAMRIGGDVAIDVNFQNATDVLQLTLGGLLRSNNTTARNVTYGATANLGIITAGTAASTGTTELILYSSAGTHIFNSSIKDTKDVAGIGGTGIVSFVKSGGASVQFGGAMTYTGGTTMNTGTLTLNSGASMLGDITLNFANLTETTAQQFASNAFITINQGGTVTLVGSNAMRGALLNSIGGTSTPTITGGTVTFGSGGLTAINDNVGITMPTVSSIVELGGSNLTISTSGIAPMTLLISGTIQNGTGTAGLVKNGSGALVLSGTNTFNGGVQLNQGTLIVNNSSALGTGALTLADDTTIESGAAVQTLANAYSVAGKLSVGGTASTNSLTLSGVGTFAAGNHIVSVATPLQTLTLSGTVGGSGFTIQKEGLGVLAFAGNNVTFTGATSVNNGQLTLDNTVNNFVSPITVASGAVVNLNAAGVGSIGVLNGSLNISGAGQLTKTTANALSVAGSFTYTGPTSIVAGTLTLQPTSTGTAPVFNGSSGINLQANGTALILDNTGATGAFATGNSGTAINFLARDTIMQINRSADFNTTLTLGTVGRAPTATGIFNFVNNVSPVPAVSLTIPNTALAANKIIVGGAAGIINQGIYIQTGTHLDFAYRDASGFVRTAAYGVDPSSALSTGTSAFTAAGALKLTGTITGQTTLGSATALSTLTLTGQNANLNIGDLETVYVNGILRTLSGANPWGTSIQGTPYFSNHVATISGGTLDNGGQELTVRTDTQLTPDTAANQFLTISSAIAGAGGLTKTGAGYLVLSGATDNTYTGVTTLLAGTTILQKTGGTVAVPGNILLGDGTATSVVLQFGNGFVSQAYDNQTAPTSTITFNTSGSNAFLRLSGTSQTIAGLQTIAGNPIIENTESNQSSPLTPNSPAYYASTLTINNATDNNLGAASVVRDGLNTVTQQYASLALVKGGNGKLITGILNHTGGTTVNAGALVLGAATPVPATGVAGGTGLLSVASGATVDLGGFTARFDGLSGTGTIQNTSSLTNPTLSAPNFIIGNLDHTDTRTGAALTSAQSTFGGAINDGTGAVGIFLQKVGHGTQTLNPTTSLGFSKGLSVFGGTLVLDFANMTTPTNMISPSFGAVVTSNTPGYSVTTAPNNSTNIILSSVAGLSVGQVVSGTGFTTGSIGTGAFITAINTGTNTISLNANQTFTGTPTLTFGSAYLSAAPAASATLTVPSTVGLVIGQSVSGVGIPTGAYITGIASATTFTINAPVTATSGTVLSFGPAPMSLNGVLSVVGSSTGATSQTFAGVNLGPGASSVSAVVNGTSTTVALGSLTRLLNNAQFPFTGFNATVATTAYATNPGVVDFGTTGTITTTTANNATGILGTFATYGGNDWATGGGTIAAYTGYVPSSGSLTSTSNVNLLQANPVTVTVAGTTYNSLRFADTSTSSNTLTITSPGTLIVGGSGILQANTAGAAGLISGTGTLTAGNRPGASDLIIYQNSTTQPLTISTIIANNATNVTAVSGVALTATTTQAGFSQATVQNLYPGMGISATGGTGSIPAGNYIKSVDFTGTTTRVTLNVAATAGTPTTISFANANGLTKAGPGTLILGTTANTFSGQVAVLDGTLSIGTLATAGTAQPLGTGSWATVLGGGGGKTGILQYTGTTVSTALPFYLGDGGFGEFQMNNATAQALTVSSAIIGGGGLNVSSVGAGTGTVVLTNAGNNYLGVTTVKAGAILRLGVAPGTTNSALGAQGMVSNGTVVQSGGVLDLAGFTLGQEVVTIAGTGIGGTGALITSGNGLNQAAAIKNLILSANATIGTTNTTAASQIGISNGFIQGNGNTLTFLNSGSGGSPYIFFVNNVFDNLAGVTLSNGPNVANIVVNNMSFGNTVLTTTGATDIQMQKTATLGPVNLGVNAKFNATNSSMDSYVNGPVVLAATSTAATWTTGTDATLTILGSITGPGNAAISEVITKNGAGMLVFGSARNIFTGGLVLQNGTTKIMPNGGSSLLDPISNINGVTFNTLANPVYPANGNYLVLDNSKTAGSLGQTFNTLATATAGGASTIVLNNATGNSLALIFNTYTRSTNTQLFLTSNSTTAGSTSLHGQTYLAPSATGNRIDIGNYGSGVNVGVFFNTPAGTEYVIRDTSGDAYLRPIDYGTDVGTNGVAAGASIASLVNASSTFAWTKISGTVTTQTSGSIGSLTIGAAGSLTIDVGNTLTVDTKGLLKNGGGTGTISGGTLQLGSSGAGEFLLRADKSSDNLILSSLLKLPTTAGNTIYKYGQGRVTIAGANISANLTTAYDLREGILRLAGSTALGATANAVTVNTPSVLEIDGTAGNLTIANNVSAINSSGWNGQATGGIRNIAGANTYSGTVAMGGTTVVGSDSGSITFTNTFSGGQDLYLAGAGNIALTGNVSAGAAKTFYHIGTGLATVKSTAAIGFNGNIVNRGGMFSFDYGNMATPTNMIPTAATLFSMGGTYQFIGKSGAVTSQTVTGWGHRGGVSRWVGVLNGATSLTVNLGTYTLDADLGTANFALATGVTFTLNRANAQNGILGPNITAGDNWAVSSGASAGVISALATYTEFTGVTGGATVDHKISTGTPVSVSGTQTLNSLKFDASSAAQTLNIGATAQVDVNAMLFVGSNNTTINGNATGILGRTTTANYFLNNGSGNVAISNTVIANNTTFGTIFAGIGSGGFSFDNTTAFTTTTGALYFQGGQVNDGTGTAVVRNYTFAGSITAGGNSINIGEGSNDNVVFTMNTGGSINQTGGSFNVGNSNVANTGGALLGTYTQNGGSFVTTGSIAMAVAATFNAVGTAVFNMNGGTFTNNGSFTIFGGNGFFTGTQTGGTILLSRPGNMAFFLGQDASQGGSATFTQSAGSFIVNGNTMIGGRNGGVGTMNISGGTTTFLQGVELGLQDYAQGTINQTGGVVSIGTGSNVADGTYIKTGANTIDLVLAYNQTTANGLPSATKGTYNLGGGELRVNGITTGQGNGYLGGSNAASSTFTAGDGTLTTTAGGTALFNWGAGTLRPFDNELTIGTGVTVTLTAAGSLLNTNDKDGIGRLVTFETPIGSSGVFGPTILGGGVVLFNRATTYSGDTTIDAGTLKFGVANALAFGASGGNVVLNSDPTAAGTLDLNGFNQTVNGINGDAVAAVRGQIVNNGGGAVVLTVGANNTTSTFNGPIFDNTSGTGTVALTKTGSGTFTVGGANTYTGVTTVSQGTLAVNGSLAAGSNVSVAAAAILSGSGSVNGLTTVASGGIVTAAASGANNLSLIGGLVLNGTATINVSSLASGVGTGAAFLTAGSLVANGSANSVTINVTSGSGYANNALYPLITYTGVSIGGTGASAFQLGTISGLTGRQSATLDFASVANQISLNVQGVSPVWSGYDYLNGVNASAWVQDTTVGSYSPNNNNWYIGTVASPTGTGMVDQDAVLFDDTVLTAPTNLGSALGAGSSIVAISNGDVTPSSMVFNNSTAVIYTLQGTNGVAGTTSLVKNNNGTINLNNANSFTGGVFINGGIVVLGNGTALGAVSNGVTFGTASNATLKLNDQTIVIGGLTGDATATVANGGSATDSLLTVGGSASSIFAGTLQDGGVKLLSLATGGTATLILTGANTYTGGTIVGAGSTLQIGNNGTSGSIVGDVSAAGSLVFNRSDSVTYSGTVSGTGSTTAANGTLILTGSLLNSGLNAVSSGATLQIGNGTTNGVVGNISDDGLVTFALNGTPMIYANTISGSGAVTFASGTLILTGALSNSGTDTINLGATLQIGNGTLNGTFSSDVTDNGTLTFALNSTPVTYSKSISGTGNLAVSSGMLILDTGSNTYTGTTTISSGATLQIGSGGTSGSINALSTVTDNGSLIINRSGTASFGSDITGTGSLTVNGPATLTLSGTNDYTGATNIQRGTTKLGSSSSLPTDTALTVGSGGQSATFDLFGQNAQIGTLVAAGTVANQTITNSSTATNSILTINTASGNSVWGGKVTNGVRGLGVTVIGGGSLTYTGSAAANTYTLATAIQNGTFFIGAAGSGTAVSPITLGGSGTIGLFDLNGFNASVGGLSADAAAVAGSQRVGTTGSTANTLTLTVPAATTYIFPGTIQDSLNAGAGTVALTVTNNATGVQALTGTNSYSSTTNITAGTLQIGNNTTTGTLGTGAVTNAGTLLFNRSNTYTLAAGNLVTGAGAVTLASGTVAVAVDNQFNTTGALNFGASAGAAANVTFNASSGNSTFGSFLVRTNSTTANSIVVGTGKTLNFNGTGNFDIQAPTLNSTAALNVSGGGTLSINTTGSFLLDMAAVAAANTVVDFSGLSTFTSTTSTFAVGQGNGSGGVVASLNLATSNTITNSGIFYVGRSQGGAAGTNATLRLGQTNVINSGTAGTSPIYIGTDKANGTLVFNSGLTNPTLKIRGSAGGNTAADLNIGVQATNTGTAITGNVLLTAGSGRSGGGIDAILTTLKIGEGSNGTSAGTAIGTLEYDQGSVTATNVIIGSAVTGSVAGSTGTGTLNIAGGALNVGSGGIVIGNKSGGAANAVGTLNISGGTVTLGSAGITTGGAGTGTATSTLNLNGGTLDLNGNAIGASGALITNLTFAAGTLSNIGQINNGAALNKTTGGTLTLSGNNTYTGATTISAGVLQISSELNLGTSPGAFTAGQLTINGGTLATTASFTIDDTTRGITLGASGGTIQTANSTTLTIANAIAGPTGSLTKTGAGALVLSTSNSYAGPTNVNDGTLIAAATGATSSSSIVINNGGTFAAESTVAGPITVNSGGILSPGLAASGTEAGIGTMTVSASGDAVTLFGGSTYRFAFSSDDTGTAGIDWNLLEFTAGQLALNADGDTNRIKVMITSLATKDDPLSTPGVNGGSNAFDPTTTSPASYQWLFMKGAAPVDTSNSTNFGGDINNLFTFDSSNVFPPYSQPDPMYGSFWISTSGNDLYLNYAAVPEPGSMLLIGVAGLGFAAYRRRKLRRDAKAGEQSQATSSNDDEPQAAT